jgi:quinoprotein glucose dehydrogenase
MNVPSKSYRTPGLLMLLLGVVLIAGGIHLVVNLGASPYFLCVGIGLVVAGALVRTGSVAGPWAYLAVFFGMVIWSYFETRGVLPKFLPRIALPGMLCVYLFSPKIYSGLGRAKA